MVVSESAMAALLHQGLGRRATLLAVVAAPLFGVLAHACATTQRTDYVVQVVIHFGSPLALICAMAACFPVELPSSWRRARRSPRRARGRRGAGAGAG